MPISPDRLQRIRRFDELIDYLRDELDWPTEDFAFDDLTFEYDPAELGLKNEEAVKVKTIHQLRPLHQAQPWGIFFVEFGKKRLPIVILRRILRHLVFKKRASANKAERPAWQPRDLLFISATGEDANRKLTFAHFVEREETGLAELRVLGWDTDDTPLHMDYVARVLGDKLRWQDKYERDPAAWCKEWSDAFVLRHRHVIRTSQELAAALAELARNLRSRIRTILRAEDGFGEIRKLQRAFRDGLIHDLDDDGFADMFAQTVTYGLFSLACRRTIPGEGTAFVKDDLSHYFTSPFLKEMLGIFLGIKTRRGKIDFDELGVSDVTDLLTSPDTHMEVVLADFNNKTRGEDPVIHFYEHFLSAYNKQLKIQRGVFYTPQPVVSYIVRSVHELLQTEFGLADGLADTTTWGEMLKKHPGLKLPPLTDEPGEKRTISPDEPFVQILDPATGTATFLVEVIDVIHRTLTAKWKQQRLTDAQQRAAWNDYVPQHLLPRLHAFELMMAPYAIAHMKIGLKLAETGYRFGTEERARIYLTNALEPWVKQLPLIGFDALAHEAAAVNEIKWYKRFTVVIGNPPYSYESVNNGPWIAGLMSDYMRVDGAALNERNPRGLQDDYVKFVRLAQFTLDQSGNGVLGFITNHGFLSNPTFRGMRHSLKSSFGSILALDLHGNANRGERAPDGGADENVFDILQGVSIICGTKKPERKHESSFHSDLFGIRELKYRFLLGHSITSTSWKEFESQAPFFLFVFRELDLQSEYNSGVSVADIFPLNSVGISTSRDSLCIQFTHKEMIEVAERFGSLSNEKAREEFHLGPDVAEWSIAQAKADLKAAGVTKELIKPVFYRPFDVRYTCFTGQSRGFHSRPRPEVMRQLLDGTNLALCSNRQVNREFRHVFVTRHIGDGNAVSLASRERTYLFPLFLQTADSETELRLTAKRQGNLRAAFLKQIAEVLSLSQSANGNPPA